MAKINLIATSQDNIALDGMLTYKSIALIKDQLLGLFAKQQHIEVDLAKVQYSDSAGLALLVNWLRDAKRFNKTLAYINMPSQMRSIAEVTGLCPILLSEEERLGS